MPDQHDRSGVDDDRADRVLIEQAAAKLRRNAIRAGYAGLPNKHIAFSMALVLDELALHCGTLPDDLRAASAQHCADINRPQ